MREIFPFASLISFGNVKSKNCHKMESRILENSVQNLREQHHEQFLFLNNSQNSQENTCVGVSF